MFFLFDSETRIATLDLFLLPLHHKQEQMGYEQKT